MTAKWVNGKYVIEKDGVYFALTPTQIDELRKLIDPKTVFASQLEKKS